MFIRIFEPNPSKDRWEYWIVLFPDDVEPVVHKSPYPDEAEIIAAKLADQHGCQWKYAPNFEDPPHWYDEEGNLRAWNRLELVHLVNGRGQLNTFSGDVRLFVESGSISNLLEQVQWSAELWAAHQAEDKGDGNW